MVGKDTSVGASGVAEENVIAERGSDPLPPSVGRRVVMAKASQETQSLPWMDKRVLEETMGDVKDRLGIVEQNLQTMEDHVLEELESLKKAVMGQDELHTRFMELFANLQEQLNVVKVGVEETRQETTMCKRAIAGGAIVTHSPRVDAPKPKEFGSKRDAKELDNFIWHMERYFEGASIMDEKAKVRTATLYLTDTATLWWRKKHNNIEKGLCTIDTWDVFKKEIKRQFYPENVTYEARKKLREIKHKSSIHDYMEWVNTLLECYLRHFVSANQMDWARLLDMAQFSYNLMRSEAMNQSPFEIAIGQQPLIPLALAGDCKGRSPLAAQVARPWNEQADVARSYLDKAGRKMKKWADKRRRSKEYNLGDMVMLKLLPQQFKSFRKVHKGLIRKYEGPFPILAKVGKSINSLFTDFGDIARLEVPSDGFFVVVGEGAEDDDDVARIDLMHASHSLCLATRLKSAIPRRRIASSWVLQMKITSKGSVNLVDTVATICVYHRSYQLTALPKLVASRLGHYCSSLA
ncbi:hypothetical protein RJ639_038891 [Escallonia herrerae]|uniref:Retrotransposon gag domain-containing protein n=1 Tax=Escallonia herrerae TaxID=1293975 RepID=A0AA88WMX3_9ASTE|nr:hypothetical protein RJ639_038891 [Escallonia herrerae]